MRTAFLLVLTLMLGMTACSSDDADSGYCEDGKCVALGNGKSSTAAAGGSPSEGSAGSSGDDSPDSDTGGVTSVLNTAPVDPIIDAPACGECAGQLDCVGPSKGPYCATTTCVCYDRPVTAADGTSYYTRFTEIFIAEGDNGRYCSECPGTSDRTCWREQGQYIWDRCTKAP